MAGQLITWVLCPNLWGARLFAHGSRELGSDDLKFVREFARPKTQTKLEDFPSDDDMAEMIAPPEDPAIEKRVAQKYMNYLSREMEQAAVRKFYDYLILCAEPHLLSILLDELGPSTYGKLLGTVDQDLYEANESDLKSYVTEIFEQRAFKKTA